MARRKPFDTERQPAVVRQAWGDFLHARPWTWWATLTFAYAVTEQHAHAAFRRWCHELARRIAREHVPVAWALEHAGDSWHLHVLLHLPPGSTSTREELHALWREVSSSAGHTDIKRFDSDLGSAWYLSKTPTVDTNVACPRTRLCRRERGCVVAPGPWRSII